VLQYDQPPLTTGADVVGVVVGELDAVEVELVVLLLLLLELVVELVVAVHDPVPRQM
jgi:hypothetical protein